MTMRPPCSWHETVSRAPAGRYVALRITDSGVGMDLETLSQIYEPFFTTKELGKGTGLGLSTVYGIVKQSEGHVSVHSTPGRGTEFTIFFPEARKLKETPTSPIKEEEVQRGTETILLVEDESATRAAIATSLERNGYTVLQAGDGEEALSVYRLHGVRVDLLLTDIVMPRMGGTELADRISADVPHARHLFISGYSESDALEHFVKDNQAAVRQVLQNASAA